MEEQNKRRKVTFCEEARGEYLLRNEKVFMGLEDSKKTWKLCDRSGAKIVHETSMLAQYEVLRIMLQNYLNNQFAECRIQVMYEAGFGGRFTGLISWPVN